MQLVLTSVIKLTTLNTVFIKNMTIARKALKTQRIQIRDENSNNLKI